VCAQALTRYGKNVLLNRFTAAISLLARNAVPEYYLVLVARFWGNEIAGWGKRFVSRSQKVRYPDRS
jgi:hypothetical protein